MSPSVSELNLAGGRRVPFWLWALGVTSLMQATTALLTGTLPVIGPILTAAAGVPPEWVGHLTAMSSLGTMLFLLGGNPLLPRFGAVRLLQLGVLLGAASLCLTMSGWWPVMLLSAILVGLGYGPSPPAGSEILHRYAPRRRRVLVFSIKQAAVPFGGAVAGIIVPPLAATFGWRVGLGGAGLIAVAMVVLVQPWRARLDNDRDNPPAPTESLLSAAALKRPFAALAAVPDLKRLSYIGFAFAVAQGSLLGFFVTDLVDGLGVALPAAGLVFAVLQGTGVVARICVGWIADRIGSAQLILGVLTVGSTGAALLAAAMASDWPWWAFVAAAAAIGFAATSWNGVYLAEIARVAPEGRVGDATSGASLLAFVGYVIGPAVFASLAEGLGSYRTAFALVALLPLSASLIALRRWRAAVP